MGAHVTPETAAAEDPVGWHGDGCDKDERGCPRDRSLGRQKITFARLSLGDFVAQRGRIDFQIGSAQSILVEKMHFRWCGGNVETQSVRLIPGKEDLRVTFYCDRLNLAQVLEQFGAATAEGQ